MKRSLLVALIAVALAAMLATPSHAIPANENPHHWTGPAGPAEHGGHVLMFITREDPRYVSKLTIWLWVICDDGSEGLTSFGFGSAGPIVDGYVRYQESHVFDFEGWFGKNRAHGWASHQSNHCSTGRVDWIAAPRDHP
jgi:hypothetical protein